MTRADTMTSTGTTSPPELHSIRLTPRHEVAQLLSELIPDATHESLQRLQSDLTSDPLDTAELRPAFERLRSFVTDHVGLSEASVVWLRKHQQHVLPVDYMTPARFVEDILQYQIFDSRLTRCICKVGPSSKHVMLVETKQCSVFLQKVQAAGLNSRIKHVTLSQLKTATAAIHDSMARYLSDLSMNSELDPERAADHHDDTVWFLGPQPDNFDDQVLQIIAKYQAERVLQQFGHVYLQCWNALIEKYLEQQVRTLYQHPTVCIARDHT